MIRYIVESHKPNAHLFNIRMIISKPDPDGQRISMANWIPGSYVFREYARHIVTIQAFAGNRPLNLKKIDNSTWECEKTSKTITIEYVYYAWELSVVSSYLDQNQGFFNGSSIFLMAHGKEKERCDVELIPPNTPNASHWRVATSLFRKKRTKKWGFGEYYASSFQHLIDHPVTMGVFEILEFQASKVPHYIVISGKHDGDLRRVSDDVAKICEQHIKLFEEAPPFDHFIFMVAILEDGEGGGLEHRYSTALMVERTAFPVAGDHAQQHEYIYMLSLFSHEYFHAWNVKRIKPAGFMPYDLNEKTFTTQLWSFEGVTSYYADLAMIRAKVIEQKQYLELISQTITKLLRNPGRKKQTVADSSFDVWIKFNMPDENSLNAVINYYVKGHLIGLMIDLALRLESQNKRSLDDVMRYLWRHYGKVKKGVPEKRIDHIIDRMSKGTLTQLLNDALYSTKELPLERILSEFGFELELRSALTQKELLGKGLDIQAHQKLPFKQGIFGCATYNSEGRVFVSHVNDESAAEEAGISAGDEFVAINGIRVTPGSIDRITKRLKVGQWIAIYVFRHGLLSKLKMKLSSPPLDFASITIKKDCSEEQLKWIERWLMGG